METLCESGWTGDRCQLPLGHEGEHDNEERETRISADTDRCAACGGEEVWAEDAGRYECDGCGRLFRREERHNE